MTKSLPKLLQPALKALEKDLLARAKLDRVEAGLKAAWEKEKSAGQSGLGFDPWRRERVTQIAVAWILSIVFVRTLEDRRLIDPRVAGPTPEAVEAAEDREATLTQLAPFVGARGYLLAVFRELSKLPGARDVFDARHNPVWVLSPSAEGAKALLEFFRKKTDGKLELTFEDPDTRFLGDLYQDLSATVRDRYALLQTPEFVEEFILDQTLDPAIATYGLSEVKLIDPTCGSGHFLLGAFQRLLERWRKERPAEAIEDLAKKALAQVFGVDINPYAVAIARFRLVLALVEAVGVKRLDKAPDLRPNVVVADSLLHRLEDSRAGLSSQITLEEAVVWGDGLFGLEDPAAVERVLSQRYQAVVGNPPYITEKDGVKRRRFIEMYDSAAGQYALAAPFTERFFDLADDHGGFVGLINANSFTKRDFGEPLVKEVLPKVSVTKVIDTSGCYIPGHGTPTLLLFGRNQPPNSLLPVVAVLGKRGETEVPINPALAPVWSEIIGNHDSLGFEGTHVSVESIARPEMARHPWVLVGGGARLLMKTLEARAFETLNRTSSDLGFSIIVGEDDAYIRPASALHGLPSTPLVVGDAIRDWTLDDNDHLLRPFRWTDLAVEASPALLEHLWPWRKLLEERIVSGSTSMKTAGRKWFDVRRLSRSKHATPLVISFAFVATHNHFILDRGGKVFKQSAPIIKLKPEHTEADHQALLGYLNSSTTAFWCRLVMFPKGGDQVGDGARLSSTQWNRHLEYAGTLLQQLPVPELARLKESLLDLVVAAEDAVKQLSEGSAEKVVAAALGSAPTLASLRAARTKLIEDSARLRGVLISLQEEMDWRVYGLFGLPTVTASSIQEVSVPVAPEHRPVEVRLARDVATDISASEWFRLHQRVAPSDVGGPLAELYRKRLRLIDDPERGKDLRLLETPETKRRWPSPDAARDFSDAARSALLQIVEDVFRVQPKPMLLTARQLSNELGRHLRVQALAELLAEESGQDLVKLLSELLDAEGVPFVAALRYSETGLEKRRGWEDTWALQRAEDQGTLEAELALRNLSAFRPPDKYAIDDFQRSCWRHRGGLDVPKERFVTVPPGASEDDPTPPVGWAGWDHLQTAHALAALYQQRKSDGWGKERLTPLLAGLEERLCWLLQWHNEPSAEFGGMRLGEFYRQFVSESALALGLSTADLRAWRPTTAASRARAAKAAAPTEVEILSALRAWGGEADASPEDLAGVVGSNKTAVSKLLKALVEAQHAEKTNGRPARYRAVRTSA